MIKVSLSKPIKGADARVEKLKAEIAALKAAAKEQKPDGRANNGSIAKIKDGRAVNVYLDAASLARAAAIGSGNVSEGIRRALKEWKALAK